MNGFFALGGLFTIAFLAATVFPAQSEAALVALQRGGYPVVALVIAASLGNTLGAILNWVLGRGIERFHSRRWFPVAPASLARASQWYGQWGRWSLLLSWMPIAGDAITVAAGVLREPLPSFVFIVFLAKAGRYIVIAAMTAGLMS